MFIHPSKNLSIPHLDIIFKSMKFLASYIPSKHTHLQLTPPGPWPLRKFSLVLFMQCSLMCNMLSHLICCQNLVVLISFDEIYSEIVTHFYNFPSDYLSSFWFFVEVLYWNEHVCKHSDDYQYLYQINYCDICNMLWSVAGTYNHFIHTYSGCIH